MTEKDDQQSDHSEEPETRSITFEEFTNAVGNLLRVSQRANWEKKASAEKSSDKSDTV